MGNINIKIIDPNSHSQLEEALSDMIAYELVSRGIHKNFENDPEMMEINF